MDKNNIQVIDAVDNLFSHNEVIALWVEDFENTGGHKLIWKGMAWALPDEFKHYILNKFLGIIPESISEADTLNIEVIAASEPCEETIKLRELICNGINMGNDPCKDRCICKSGSTCAYCGVIADYLVSHGVHYKEVKCNGDSC